MYGIKCQSKGSTPILGKCISIKDCQRQRGNYQIVQSDIDLCGITKENDPLVCCTDPHPLQLKQRLSVTSEI